MPRACVIIIDQEQKARVEEAKRRTAEDSVRQQQSVVRLLEAAVKDKEEELAQKTRWVALSRTIAPRHRQTAHTRHASASLAPSPHLILYFCATSSVKNKNPL